MIKRLLCVSAVALLLPLTSGCGYTCEDGCADAEEGGCKASGCESDCKTWESLVESSSCDDEYDDNLSCADDNSDTVCDNTPDNNPCKAQIGALNTCVSSFCDTNPDDADCKALFAPN